MKKIVHSGLFFIGVSVFIVIFSGVVLYWTRDDGKTILAMVTPLFLYLSTICFWPESEDGNKVMPSRSDLIVGVTFLILWLYLLVLELFVETWRLSFVLGGLLFIFGVVVFFANREVPFYFSLDKSPRDVDFELDLWNRLILDGQGKSNQIVVSKAINNRKGLTLADVALVKAELRKWDTDKLQEVLDFIGLPTDYTVFSLSVKNLGPLRNLLPKKLIAPLFAAVSAYTVFQNYINSFLGELLTKIQTSLTSFDGSVVLDILAVLALLFLGALLLFPVFRALSGETKRKQVKQMLPKLLKEVLEEKQSQVNRSRQFPKRWTR